MRRRIGLVLAAVACSLVIGCGSSGFQPPESSARPDGYKGASPPITRTLSGSSIHIDQAGLSLIERFEGWSSCVYWDGYGHVYTRGYGETEGIHSGSPCISRTQGEANLGYRIERFYQWAVRGLGVSLNHHQIDALDSFAWNLGAGIFTGSLRYDLQHGRFYDASLIMLRYDHAGGVRLPGLTTRRQLEAALLLKPEAVASPAAVKADRQRRLAADERQLVALRGRISVLRHVLVSHGCVRRRDHHQHLGPTCTRWFAEGNDDHNKGVKLDAEVARLKRELK